MFCNNCGKEINEGAVICINCGCEIKKEESNAIGWGALGCCIPIAGLILFLVWKKDKPKAAKAAGIGALISVIALVIYYVFILMFAALLFGY